MKALAHCGLHFRAELTEVDYEIYLKALVGISAGRISESLVRCVRECNFMPKVKDILDRVPEEMAEAKAPDLKIVREWDEPYGSKKLHWIEYEGGYKQARFVA